MGLTNLNINDLLAKKYARGEAFSAGIKINIQNSRIFTLVVLVTGWNWFVQTKFPGGKSEKNETPVETLEREWMQETGRSLKKEKTKYVHHKILKDGHVQFFFLIEDDKEIGPPSRRDPDTELPKWELITKVLSGLYGQHRIALIRALDGLLIRDKNFCNTAYISDLLNELKKVKSKYSVHRQLREDPTGEFEDRDRPD